MDESSPDTTYDKSPSLLLVTSGRTNVIAADALALLCGLQARDFELSLERAPGMTWICCDRRRELSAEDVRGIHVHRRDLVALLAAEPADPNVH